MSDRLSANLMALLLCACVSTDSKDSADPDDLDGDGFSAEDGDCDDGSASVNPAMADAVGDEIDSNCDLLDGVDADGDGHASEASGGDDCDDADPHLPGTEVWNGVDDDCNGCVDDAGMMMLYVPESTLVGIYLTGDPAGYTLGLAETGSADGWYGEDCLDGASNCHAIEADEDYLRIVDSPEQVVFGESTLFDADRIHRATWLLIDSAGTCHAFGDDPSYYAALGCCVP